MELEDYYLQLRQSYPVQGEGQPLTITLDEFASALDCTRRNAQLLIQKMIERSYVEWSSGRGRGNRSTLVFLQNKEELLLRKAKRLAEQGEPGAALEFVQKHSDDSLNAEFHSWLISQFGLQRRTDELDVLRFPFYRPIPDLDPMNVIRRTEAHMVRQIFDTLVAYDAAGRTHKPGLAHHWEHDETRTHWTFYLRKGVFFHHGKRMTAEDVKFTFERIKKEKPDDWLTANMEDIEVLGTTSVRIRLRESNGLFLNFISQERFSIVPSDLGRLVPRIDYQRMPIGTGPFRIAENTATKLVLEANDSYYDGRPFLDRVEIWVWPDYRETALREDYSPKEAQVLYFEAVHRSKSGNVLNRAEAGSSYLTFNLSRPGPLQDVRVRSAIHGALDRQEMVRELGGRRLKPSSGFDPSRDEEGYGTGVGLRQAQELLEQSDYKGETLQFYTYDYSANKEDAGWIRSRLERLGVRMETTVLPIRELSQAAAISRADLILSGEVLGVEPAVTLIDMYRSSPGYIRNHLDPANLAKVDAAVSKALSEGDPNRCMDILRDLEVELRDASQLLFLYHSHQTVSVDPALNGIALNAWGKIDYKDIWLKDNPL